MAWKIIQIFLSIGLIIGGLSGELVLKGTNSSVLLVVVGVLLLAYNIYSIFAAKKAKQELDENLQIIAANAEAGEKIETPCTVSITRPSGMIGAAMGVQIFLNGVEQEVLRNGKTVVMQTNCLHNVLQTVYSADGATNSLNFDAIPEGNIKITLKYSKNKLMIE